MMEYVSTRGAAPKLTFADVLLTGLARDGGLYVPASWPQFSAAEQRRLAKLDYAELASEVMWPFVEGAVTRPDFDRLVATAYSRFSHQAVAPLKQLDHGVWLMELFHGPTLAFKDFALQLLGLLFDHVLTERGERVTIVGATSGDTGSAAIEACRDRQSIDIFILHPEGRTSEVQRRQMTTVSSSNVFNVAVKGSFDDCQDIVKAMFNDESYRDRVKLSAVNSINWARIMAQIAYYACATLRLGGPDRAIDVIVPTGNFGNVFAAYAAKQMGFSIGAFGVASNRNDILTRFFRDNDMSMRPVEPSLSPSMDIQVSSNFERLLFDLMGRDGDAVAKTIADFRASGQMTIGQGGFERAKEQFSAHCSSDEETLAEITRTLATTGETLDPHTATGTHMAENGRLSENPVVVMGTAHPAKFPDAVEKATGQRPTLPPFLADLYEREERYDRLPNDVGAVQDYVAARSRVSSS